MSRLSMIPSLPLLFSLLSLPFLISCGAGGPADPAVVVRDSAGIRLIESARPAWREGEEWRVAPGPMVEVGVQDGPAEYQLYRVGAAIRLGDGRIVLANRGTNEIRQYDSAGRHLLTVGGTGDGPGEFRALAWVSAPPGDSILAWDASHNRLSIFTPRGELAGTTQIEPVSSGTPTPGESFTAPYPMALTAFADGSLLARSIEIIPNPGEGVRRDSINLVRYLRSGAIAERLGRFPGFEFFARQQGDELLWERRVFGRNTHVAVRGRELLVGTNDRFEVVVMGGERQQVFRRVHEHRPVRSAEIQAYGDLLLEAARDEASRAYSERVLELMSYPSELPPYRDLIADGEGNVWVEHYRAAPEEQPRWSVFGADGRWLGEVATPAGLRIHEIGAGYVLGVWTDEVGIEYLRLYELLKGGE